MGERVYIRVEGHQGNRLQEQGKQFRLGAEISAIYERYNNSVDSENDEFLAPFPPNDLQTLSLKFREAIFTLLAFYDNEVDDMLATAVEGDPPLEPRHLIKVLNMLRFASNCANYMQRGASD